MKRNPGIGATDELSLRVSVATLVRVIFKHPANGVRMLALERKATLHENVVEIKSQPFGGAIRILDVDAIHDLIGDFHFDSERSRAEEDFRIVIRPSNWSVLREFCIQHIGIDHDLVLETDPARELAEEFFDALKFKLLPGQYGCKPRATVLENKPSPSANIHARDIPTVRVYRIHDVHVLDPALGQLMVTNSEDLSHNDLCELAWADFQNGGKGRANAVLALPLKQIGDFYSALSPQERDAPISYQNNRLDETVPAVLENIIVPKYQKLRR